MNKNPVQVTKQGLEALIQELKDLNDKRPAAVSRLAYARSQGDLKENSDYHSAREDLGFLDGRIEELEDVIKNAKVVDNSMSNGGVGVGTKVTLQVSGKEVIYHIVGEWEADPMKKKISHTSPLGQALDGKKPGEEVEVEAPAGKVLYKIVSVN